MKIICFPQSYFTSRLQNDFKLGGGREGGRGFTKNPLLHVKIKKFNSPAAQE